MVVVVVVVVVVVEEGSEEKDETVEDGEDDGEENISLRDETEILILDGNEPMVGLIGVEDVVKGVDD